MKGIDIVLNASKDDCFDKLLLIEALAYGHANILTCPSQYRMGLTDDSVINPDKCHSESRDCNKCLFESLMREY